ncbi:YihY/virulence factor BrkB family protein [Chryseobacterium sp. Ch-15]|uniref:YihY/virulence factor BrkB family protein n=1 Tax=Chryseobacterium muglaense TaxID=2893752 RepID=A0A9Q3US23_9FLAO|nr:MULTISPECIES: YihY/virulence factor BrkB family protein [Chryseobacterium]MBD3906556.1 YihY/virulence factor BrkB family protein [Chryseobacterium muglaense]MBO6184458.1 YihY/virulence factor BrkB family protein [Chryseobacterium sp.]MCC9033572.1 YihY/virulence factor BrkB family protein [Chryseobacterium muglaense]MCM2556310.1 YihY/virulence factor BrkB family protein [Chryseobacterium muglaense]
MALKIPKFIVKFQKFLDDIHLPVLGISLWQMFQIYISGIFKGNIGRKAAAISWSFTLSLFPFLLFLLSVIPYMPHYDKLQFYIFEVLMHNIFPSNIEGDVRNYIEDNIIPNMKGISNLTILVALVFATNGTFSLINGFNENSEEKLSDVKEFILSFFITIGFVSIIFLALFGVYYTEVVLKDFSPGYNLSWIVRNLSKIIGFVSFPLFYFILLAMFYWLGTVKIIRFRQAIPGAILTTVLFIVTTYFFALYVKNIARYNVLYGSIGSMILLMVWVNVNVYLLLFGNELNMALRKLRIEKLLSDEIKREAKNYHAEKTEPNLEGDDEHKRPYIKNNEK